MSAPALLTLVAEVEWARPWALLLLPLPVLVRLLLPPASATHGSVLRLPFAPPTIRNWWKPLNVFRHGKDWGQMVLLARQHVTG